jgi:hypothetical protein
MNRRRNETRTPAWIFCALLLAAAIMATGGVLHAIYKNRQIQITREIDTLERRVEQYRLDIRTTDMRMDQLLNRFVIRKQIAENGGGLEPIPPGLSEDVDSTKFSRQSVAAAVR